MNKLIKALSNLLRVHKPRNPAQLNSNTCLINEQMASGLARIKKQNMIFNTIVDVGAAKGAWSNSAKKLWPECAFVLFEPLEERKTILDQLTLKNANFHFIPSAAGKASSKVHFYISDDLDGSGVAKHTDSNVRIVNLTSIDGEIKNLQLNGPYMIKLDTHGYELPILEGCINIMNEVSVFVIECYGFYISENSLLFSEMCSHMDSLGFRLFDIVDVMYRPYDGAFWQCDAFFVRKENKMFDYNDFN